MGCALRLAECCCCCCCCCGRRTEEPRDERVADVPLTERPSPRLDLCGAKEKGQDKKKKTRGGKEGGAQ